MPKHIRTLVIGITTLLLSFGLTTVAAGSANAATKEHRTLVKLQKKETDAVVTVLNKAFETDVTDTFLQQVGLDPADGWAICFVDPYNPNAYTGVFGYTMQNRLQVGAWLQNMQEGDTQLGDTEMVQACTRTQITEPLRLSVMVHEPFRPVLDMHLTSGHRCQVVFTNRDDSLTGYLSLSDEIKYGFYKSRIARPGTTKTITLKRSAPETLTVNQALYANDKGGSYLSLEPLGLNTKTCTPFVTASPYPAG